MIRKSNIMSRHLSKVLWTLVQEEANQDKIFQYWMYIDTFTITDVRLSIKCICGIDIYDCYHLYKKIDKHNTSITLCEDCKDMMERTIVKNKAYEYKIWKYHTLIVLERLLLKDIVYIISFYA